MSSWLWFVECVVVPAGIGFGVCLLVRTLSYIKPTDDT